MHSLPRSGASPNGAVLPLELDRFLDLPRPVSLLVRGGPGTGRTLLARAIADRLGGPGIVITDEPTAWSRPSARDGGIAAGVRVLHLKDLLPGRDRIHPLETTPSQGEAGIVAPRETCRFLIVDTWDAFTEHMIGRGRRGGEMPDTERSAFDWAARGVDRFVAIAGLGRSTQIEYQVDGILETVQSHVEERTERWMRSVKLREVEMDHSQYPFTLHEGRFRSFGPYPYDPALHWSFEPDPDPAAPGLWPGSAYFASAFGRLPSGGLTLIEVDPQSPSSVHLAITVPIILHAFFHQGRIVFVPPPTLFPSEIWTRVREVVRPTRFGDTAKLAAQKLRILSPFVDDIPDPDFGGTEIRLRRFESSGPIMTAAPERPSDGSNGSSADTPLPRFQEITDFIREVPAGRSNLELVYLDGLISAAREIGTSYSADALASVTQHELGGRRLNITFVAREADPLLKGLYSLARVHLRLRFRQGRYFLQGIRPWTANFVLETLPPAAAGGRPYVLLPVS